VPAAEAERIGLVNHVVSDGELDQRVDAFAERLARGAIQAIKYSKVSVNIGLKQLAHSILDTSVGYEMLTFTTEDHKEAVHAFLEKRKPVFTGR
jgi:enoyl-CoA hydratase